jgi:hypothetical protein
MNCRNIQEQLPDYHDGLLSKADAASLRAHLDTCEACRRESEQLATVLAAITGSPAPEPSPHLRRNFQRMLAQELAAEKKASKAQAPSLLSRLVAALLPFEGLTRGAFATLLLCAGLGTGWFLHRPAPIPTKKEDPETTKQIADLRNRLDAMSQLFADNAQSGRSDSSRLIQTASYTLPSNGTRNDDEHQIAKLIGTMAFDPSTNVRLCALEALYAHADKPIVRKGLLAALPKERSPLVQIAMIDFLAAVDEPAGAEVLQAVSKDTNNDKTVREAAQRALTRL